MMRTDILTIFPGFFRGPLEHGITRRACEAGLIEIKVHDLREFTHDKHRTVDDRPFGGGEGMVLKPEPLFECLRSLDIVSREDRIAGRAKQSVILLSAQGQRFNQATAAEIAGLERVVLICGRYEGVDERVADFLADREISIGDYVLSGGEIAAAKKDWRCGSRRRYRAQQGRTRAGRRSGAERGHSTGAGGYQRGG